MLTLSPESVARIAAHAEATYPDECVGLLLGRLDGELKLVLATYQAENRWQPRLALTADDAACSRRDRFYLHPRETMRAEREARAHGLELLGLYHSHPEQAAVPSERDRLGAQAIGGSFAFLIQAVRRGRAAELAAWRLIEQGAAFQPEELAPWTGPS